MNIAQVVRPTERVTVASAASRRWDPITAIAAVHILAIRPGRTLTGLVSPSVLLSVTGVLTPILDLTDPGTMHLLGTTSFESAIHTGI